MTPDNLLRLNIFGIIFISILTLTAILVYIILQWAVTVRVAPVVHWPVLDAPWR